MQFLLLGPRLLYPTPMVLPKHVDDAVNRLRLVVAQGQHGWGHAVLVGLGLHLLPFEDGRAIV
jgi:hypothetical protein